MSPSSPTGFQAEFQVTGFQVAAADVVADPRCVLQALWRNESVGYAVLEAIASPREDFRFLALNDAIAYSGLLSQSDVLGQTLSDVLPPQILQAFDRYCSDCIRTQKPVQFEVCLPAQSESVQRWQINAHPIVKEHGLHQAHKSARETTVYQLVLTATATREQKSVSAEQCSITQYKSAKTAEGRLLAIAEATPDLIGVSDAEGNVLYVNRAGREILGIAAEESVGFHVSETMPTRKQAHFETVVLPKTIANGTCVSEAVLLTRAGEEIPVSQVLMAHRDELGAVEYLSVIMRDIRGLKAVEEKLRDREQFLSIIYEGADIAIFSWDMAEDCPDELRCSGWNPTCEAATGLSIDFVLGKTPYQVFGPDQGAAIAQNNLQCAAQKRSIYHEEEIIIEEASTWWATKLNPIQDSEGRVYRVIGTTTNITELKLKTIELEAYSKRQAEQTQSLETALLQLKRAQAQMVQGEKMSSLGQMVAGIAHEINNPVNFIHANVKPAESYATDLMAIIQCYQQQYPQPTPVLAELLEDLDFNFIQKDFLALLESMKIGTQRIREIVLSLRNFSRLDEADMKAVNLQEGIDSTLVILAYKLRENAVQKPIEIVKDYQPMPLVECYPSQLNQVVMNIVSNAIDVLSHASKPTITISTAIRSDTSLVENRQAIITISDNGPGISESVQDRIFDPFFTTKPVGKGTGMGLSICYQIATEKHGGKLSVSSDPAQGTQFKIEIPLEHTRHLR